MHSYRKGETGDSLITGLQIKGYHTGDPTVIGLQKVEAYK